MPVSSTTVRGAAPSSTPNVINVTSPGAANTEFSQSLSTNTKQFLLRTRGNGKLQLSFTSGQSGTTFITLEKNASLSQQNLELTNITLYMQCDKASEIIEILEWT